MTYLAAIAFAAVIAACLAYVVVRALWFFAAWSKEIIDAD